MSTLYAREVVSLRTTEREQLIDITKEIKDIVARHGMNSHVCTIYALGATAAIMIQENWDPNIQADVLTCLRTLVPKGQWLHDRVDGNADAHIKAGVIGPSEVIPVERGKLLLSTWQNIFFCEFDGPRTQRQVIITLI